MSEQYNNVQMDEQTATNTVSTVNIKLSMNEYHHNDKQFQKGIFKLYNLWGDIYIAQFLQLYSHAQLQHLWHIITQALAELPIGVHKHYKE